MHKNFYLINNKKNIEKAVMTYFKNTNLVWFSADLAMCSFELTETEIRDYFTKVFYNNKIDGEHAK